MRSNKLEGEEKGRGKLDIDNSWGKMIENKIRIMVEEDGGNVEKIVWIDKIDIEIEKDRIFNENLKKDKIMRRRVLVVVEDMKMWNFYCKC